MSTGVIRAFVETDPRRWNVAILALLAVLTVAYLALTNENATAGYELRVLEQRVDTLRQETRRLELQGINAQAVDALSVRATTLGYVPVAHVEYLAPSVGVAVAR
jgi:hypothetical protein